jgi:hypothetical protein
MTDAPPEEPKGVSFSIIDTWKLKLPSVYLALPPDFINNVGGIVIAWGMFEKAFEDLLASMLLQTGNANKGWQNFSFEQKRGMFLAELPLCFEQEPELIGRLTALVAETHALQIKRNVHARSTYGKACKRISRIDCPGCIQKAAHHRDVHH